MNLFCACPTHASNSAVAGWNNGVLGQGTAQALWCPGCTLNNVQNPPAAVVNQSTIQANILTRQTQIQAWIVANPSGAILTAAQTLTLAQMLNGLCKLMLSQFASTTGT